jgi:hypothetical protein
MPVRIHLWLRRYFLLLALTCAQCVFWTQTRDIKPEMDIVPNVPGREEIHALTFGDDEFYFRMLTLMIQNSGDTYGRFTALRYYDFNKLYHWFNLLDELDSRSNMVPAMAANYFSQTQNTADIRYIVDYLYTHASISLTIWIWP